jgi:flagellar basal-body rod protein FlgB
MFVNVPLTNGGSNPGMVSLVADPIALAELRLRWLERRQTVLAQNVANADTPGYVARDVSPFGATLASSQVLAMTDPRHVRGVGAVGDARALRERRSQDIAPNGNTVSLDEQAIRIADTDQAHALAMTLHRRWISLVRSTLSSRGA